MTDAFQLCLKFAHTIEGTRLREGTVESIVNVLSFAINLRSISFSDLNDIGVSVNKKLINGLLNLNDSRLIEMNFQGCYRFLDLHVEQLCKKFPFLENINVCKCIKLTDKAVCSMSKHCLNLSRLNLSMLVKLTDKSILVLIGSSLHLTSLVLGGDQTNFSSDCLNTLFEHQKSSLLAIDIAGIVSSRMVKKVGETCSELTFLNVSGSLMVMDEAICSICTGCLKITQLDVSDLDNLQIHSVKLILSSLKLLRNFKFARIYGELYQGIYCLLSQKFESFSTINTHHDQVVGAVDESHPDLVYPLDTQLSSKRHTDRSKNVSECISFVQSKCVTLKDLTLSGDLQTIVLFRILNPIVGEILQNLSLCGMSLLSDEHLRSVAKLCVRLERFQVQDCPLISELGIIAVVSANLGLSALILDGGKFGNMMGDDILRHGVSSLLQLKYLRLVSLPLLTSEGLVLVAQNCLKLKDVEILKCDQLLEKDCQLIFNGLMVLNSLYVEI
jgi:hypothetical protein